MLAVLVEGDTKLRVDIMKKAAATTINSTNI